MIELTLPKELMLIRQANQKSAIFVTVGIFLSKGFFKFQSNVCNFAILKIGSADYRCIISGISKSEATNLMQNIDLTGKSRTLENMKIYYHL